MLFVCSCKKKVGKTMIFKKNSMVRIENVKKNEVYMIDVSSGKIYRHFQETYNPNFIALVLIGSSLSSVALTRVLENGDYLNNVSHLSKLLLILASVSVSFCFTIFLVSKSEQLELGEYREKYKSSKEIKNTTEIEEILDKCKFESAMIMLLVVGLFVGSLAMFNRFLIDASLETYALASTLFLFFSLITPNLNRLRLLSL